MPDYKNPLAPRRDKPKKPTYNMTKEQIDWMIAEACSGSLKNLGTKK